MESRARLQAHTSLDKTRAHLIGLRVAQLPVAWHARVAGQSKISGSVRGVFGAGAGILGMIARLWLQERQRPAGETLLFHSGRGGAAPPIRP